MIRVYELLTSVGSDVARVRRASAPRPERKTVTVRRHNRPRLAARPDGPNSKRSLVKHAVRKLPQEALAPVRTAPHSTAYQATVIQLAAVSGGGTLDRQGTAATASAVTPVRGRSRGGDLIFGGVLAVILLIACLAWEMLADRGEAPHAALQGQSGVIPAVH